MWPNQNMYTGMTQDQIQQYYNTMYQQQMANANQYPNYSASPIRPQQPAQPPIQNGGFIQVRDIEDARRWVIAPGVSMTFKVENGPYLCTKTRTYNQLEEPIFEVYRLEKIEYPEKAVNAPESVSAAKDEECIEYASKNDLQAILSDLSGIRAEIDALKTQPLEVAIKRSPAKAKKEAEE